MQTLDCVSGLHNSLELSQPSSCLDEALLCKHGKKRFPNYFQFFFPKSIFRSNFDLLMQITPLKKHKFHKKNRRAVYMPVEEMGVISHFWWDDKDKSRTFLFLSVEDDNFSTISCHCKLLKLADLKKGRFSDLNLFHFCKQPNLFLTNQNC